MNNWRIFIDKAGAPKRIVSTHLYDGGLSYTGYMVADANPYSETLRVQEVIGRPVLL